MLPTASTDPAEATTSRTLDNTELERTGTGPRACGLVRSLGTPAAAVSLALLLSLAIPPTGIEGRTAPFFAAVMVSSWYGGLWAGLVATALSVLAIDYVLIPPALAVVLGPSDLARIAVFVLVALLISSLNASRHRLEHALVKRAEQLADADRRKDEFLAMLTHELRNPLATIVYALQVVRGGVDGQGEAEAWGSIERQLRKMTRLVDDLADASRIGHGAIALHMEEVELGTVVDQAVASVQPLIAERGHVLSVGVPAGPVPLVADPMRLEQILVNLLNNAAKYTTPGGRIDLAIERDVDTVILRIRDTGVGIAPDVLPHIFGLFVQEKRPGQPVMEGLGIGLSLVRSLVEMHGGSVEARSDGPGCGSELVVCLPAVRLPASSGPHAVPRPMYMGPRQSRPCF